MRLKVNHTCRQVEREGQCRMKLEGESSGAVRHREYSSKCDFTSQMALETMPKDLNPLIFLDGPPVFIV